MSVAQYSVPEVRGSVVSQIVVNPARIHGVPNKSICTLFYIYYCRFEAVQDTLLLC
jgi:hypothetical protein